MTRINVVPVEELSDQWLIAEYHELPRCIKQDINTDNAPENYCLGKGHMKWAKHHSLFLTERFYDIVTEMSFRGFKSLYVPYGLANLAWDVTKTVDYQMYYPSQRDTDINRRRLIERYKEKPSFYKWTNRIKPKYLEN